MFEQTYGVPAGFSRQSTFHGEESYWTHWDADPEKASNYVVEQGHDTWNMNCLIFRDHLKLELV